MKREVTGLTDNFRGELSSPDEGEGVRFLCSASQLRKRTKTCMKLLRVGCIVFEMRRILYKIAEFRKRGPVQA